MTNPVAIVLQVTDGKLRWDALVFVCPGCKEEELDSSGLHMIPVNSLTKTPAWEWDSNLEFPTLSPSILTRQGLDFKFVCHSFLKAGVFQYLDDCTHSLKGLFVPMVPLEDWMF